MKYDDLLNIPYKPHGRDRNGYDCYGVVIECCRRAGTPLHDPYYESDTVPIGETERYISQGLNVREIPSARTGAIALMEYGSNLHVGYIVDRGLILHETRHGSKVSPLAAVNVKKYYEVVNESELI